MNSVRLNYFSLERIRIDDVSLVAVHFYANYRLALNWREMKNEKSCVRSSISEGDEKNNSKSNKFQAS